MNTGKDKIISSNESDTLAPSKAFLLLNVYLLDDLFKFLDALEGLLI
jgi:hypothetical protein